MENKKEGEGKSLLTLAQKKIKIDAKIMEMREQVEVE